MRSHSNPSTICRKAVIKAIAAAALCVLTVVLFNTDNRYDTVSDNVLPNLNFSQQSRHWTVAGDGAVVRYSNPPILKIKNSPGRQTRLSQSLKLPLAYEFLRVGADIKPRKIVAGTGWWHRAGLIVYSIDNRGRRMPYWPWQVAMVDGSGDWQRYEAIIPVSTDAIRMDLSIFISAQEGIAEFRNITVGGLERSNWFAVANVALIIAWIMAGLWIVSPLYLQHRKRISACLALFVFLCTLCSILIPQPELSIFLGSVRSLADKTVAIVTAPEAPQKADRKPDSNTPDARKDEAENDEADKDVADLSPREKVSPGASQPTARIIAAMPQSMTSDGGAPMAHFAAHTVLAFLITLVFRQSRPVWLLACMLVMGVATEVIQYFVVTRSVSLTDLEMNAAGILAGFLAALAWTTLVGKRGHIPGSQIGS